MVQVGAKLRPRYLDHTLIPESAVYLIYSVNTKHSSGHQTYERDYAQLEANDCQTTK